MTATLLDTTDWRILEILQRDARVSFVTLGREVAMSTSAVTERVRRLEAAGVISSYTATVDPARVGMTIMAFVRLGYPSGKYTPLHDLFATTPQVLEAHHVTGEDCFILKVVAHDLQEFQRFLTSELTPAPNVESVKTSFVIRTALSRPGVPVD